MKRILILGGGTAGTAMANRLVRTLPMDQWAVTVVDRDNAHVYQPGLLFLPFGMYRARDLVRKRQRFFAPEVEYIQQSLERIEPDANRVVFEGGDALGYDVLIIATGSRIAPSETEGLMGSGWKKDIFDFYTLEGSSALGQTLADWKGGRLVVNMVDMPIKCPVAPLEFLFLADAFFTKRGIRDKVEIVCATPLDVAFTKPKASAMLGVLMRKKDVHILPNFLTAEVKGDKRTLEAYDGREIDYDLLVTIPLHYGSEVIMKSGLGDDFGWVPTDKHTLQTHAHANIFALGDATNLPSSKAGSVAHFQSDLLVDNVLRFVAGKKPLPTFDGHANCFIETGYDKAVLIDFNYTTEPLPGRFPMPGVGPLTLLEESHANHWGKLAFRWIYWNLLLKGKDIPIDARMSMAGKWS